MYKLETDIPLPETRIYNNKYDFHLLKEKGHSIGYPVKDGTDIQRIRIALSRYASRHDFEYTTRIEDSDDERKLRVWRL
tara:strand:+ start:289 stop:525 length:237 start_codon:yes stop_codon:yes gene_type:complete